MSVIRAFIAIDLTPEIRTQLDKIAVQMRQRLGETPVRWVPAENIHLTLKFLGDVSLAHLDLLKKMLQQEVASHRCFEFSVGGVGAFPSNSRPRVVWVGVEAPPALVALQSGVENEMERLGYAREEREFSAHLTLGRVSRNATPPEVRKIAEVLQTTRVGFMGMVQVQQVHLFKSDLQPNGAVYTRLYSASLA